MAPELCYGTGYCFKVDIWGLGCLLFEMLMNKKPFEGKFINVESIGTRARDREVGGPKHPQLLLAPAQRPRQKPAIQKPAAAADYPGDTGPSADRSNCELIRSSRSSSPTQVSLKRNSPP
jgi:serine/threonine protein kinase